MMCKICNGALVLTVPGWTLGLLKLIPISSWCWPCVIADLHHHLVRPHALNFFLCFAFMLLHRETAQSELKYRLFASHSNVTQGAGNFFLRSLKFQWEKEFCPMEAQFGQVIKEPKDQLICLHVVLSKCPKDLLVLFQLLSRRLKWLFWLKRTSW